MEESAQDEIDRFRLRAWVLDSSSYRYVNEEYVDSLPPSHAEERDQTIEDYEPHSYGHGYYDTPDYAPFSVFGEMYTESRTESDKMMEISIRNCEQLISLSYYTEDMKDWTCRLNLANVLREILVLTPEQTASLTIRPSEKDDMSEEEIAQHNATNLISLLTSTTILIVECKHWRPICTTPFHANKCLSAAFLSLLLSFPKARAIRIRNLSTYSLDTPMSLFANFPSPRLLPSPSTAADSENNDAYTVSSSLHILSFSHCGAFHRTDLSFLSDCAIEHRVLPNLRHLQCYYCSGMSYPSVVAASEALNLEFDRFEISGWCWPQEAVNSKNRENYY
jgi:hypothetical protein